MQWAHPATLTHSPMMLMVELNAIFDNVKCLLVDTSNHRRIELGVHDTFTPFIHIRTRMWPVHMHKCVEQRIVYICFSDYVCMCVDTHTNQHTCLYMCKLCISNFIYVDEVWFISIHVEKACGPSSSIMWPPCDKNRSRSQ